MFMSIPFVRSVDKLPIYVTLCSSKSISVSSVTVYGVESRFYYQIGIERSVEKSMVDFLANLLGKLKMISLYNQEARESEACNNLDSMLVTKTS